MDAHLSWAGISFVIGLAAGETGVIASHLALEAAAIGAGAEVVLRSSFLRKQKEQPTGTVDEEYRRKLAVLVLDSSGRTLFSTLFSD